MQQINSMAGGDQRLRPHNHNHNHNHNHPQPLKCPRCHSLNTKFCYYNNYNLSQPRHFCKNCRRYWTKGGVLRNVPVGGASRKSKRSNNPKTTPTNNPSSSSETAPPNKPTTPPPALPSQPPELERNSNSHSHSSSESSTLTVAATEAMSAPTSNAASNNNNNVRESKILSLEQDHHHSGIFSQIGTLTSLISSNNQPLGFGFGTNNNNNNNVLHAASFRFGGEHGQWQQQNHQEYGTASFLDQTLPLEFSSSLQHKSAGHNGGFGSLDWQQGADQSLFDLPSTVDQPYWTHTHWSDQDNSTLFHLP